METNVIRLSKSCLSSKETNMVKKVLKKEFLGMGAEVKKFEDELGAFFKRKVLCVNSGTAALHLALQACSIKKGDEVLVPSITYLATFQAITATGAKPVMCDVNLEDLNISFESIKKNYTKKTKAIIPVHFMGHPCDLNKIYRFAKKKNIRIVEDSAHAFGSFYKNKKIGSIGDINCFSFDGIKNITSGEGGCIVTQDKNVLKRVSDCRLLGVIGESKKRYNGDRNWEYEVKEQGWRYHMSDINAAIGRAQLKRFKQLSKKRKDLSRYYENLLLKSPKIFKVIKRDLSKEVPHIYCVIIRDLKKRGLLVKDLAKQNIQLGTHYYPGYKLTYYKKSKKFFPNTEKIYDKVITLPLHPDLKFKNLNYIVKKLREHLNKNIYY
jgi:dTDP-4-amino-4,6-dideoxygalactose transaminase